jgi:hypothetical protein
MIACGKCGSKNLHRKGKTLYKGTIHRRYKCKDCGEPIYVEDTAGPELSKNGWDKANIADDEARVGNIPEIGLNENLEGLEVTGVTYLKKDENNVLHWIKTKAKHSSASAFQEFVDRLSERVPAAPCISAPVVTNSELLTQYTITDLHIGMYSWAQETGSDWDLNICYDLITKAVDMALSVSPDSETGLLMQLGDYAHYDGHDAITPTSGNILDADGRFQKMLEVGEDILLETIDKMLSKHLFVKVIVGQGNHDISTSDALRSLVRRYYRKNERLEVIGGPNPFYAYKHGNTMVGAHHGHLKKRATLPAYFCQYFSEMWGATQYRYLHCGHLHCHNEDEKGGALTIQHSTLAAPDAYAAHRFDKTLRSINTISYSDKYGMISRNIVPVEMLI